MTAPWPEAGRETGRRAAADLAVLVRESVAAEAPREVLHLRLGGAAPLRPHHRQLIRAVLEEALGAARSRIFDLPNGDLLAVARLPAPGLAEAEAALSRALEGAVALRRLRLPGDAAAVLGAVADSLGLDTPAEPAAAPGGAPLDTEELAAAERALAAADPANLTLAQTVCRIEPGCGWPEAEWEDRRIHAPSLAAALLPGRDIGAAPALARRLGRLAEARMLAEIARPASLAGWRPVGLPVSPATLDGAGFQRFAEALPAGRAAEVTLGLRGAELLADPGWLARAAPALRRRGFRLALDDAPAGLLALLPADRMGFDILRLRWAPGLPAARPAALDRLIAAAPGGIVLTGVDRAAAIAWGWECGIRLFQGPLVERRRRP